MPIVYNATQKDLPSAQLQRLFQLVGWSDGSENEDMISKFNTPFVNSTFVVSAWEGERLVGAVRVLSDKVIRSVVYDLLVDPAYQGSGIGRELLQRCLEQFPGTEWFLQTSEEAAGFYEKLGLKRVQGVFFHRPSKYFA